MARGYPLAESDDVFLGSGSHRYLHIVEIAVESARLWQVPFGDDAPGGVVTGLRGTSP
ncbi:hypothetical protein ACFYO7_29415 [Nocardia salmonicida]|uniref:hypothetical protein n=1 Tax=Nocardia salmonicida TaxID=53431 RepID=UPI0036C85DEB